RLGLMGDGAGPEQSGAGQRKGSSGVVASENAAASQDPAATGSLSGGPSGQTPAYGQPGGAPSMVTESGDGAAASVGSGDPPVSGANVGADAGEQIPPK